MRYCPILFIILFWLGAIFLYRFLFDFRSKWTNLLQSGNWQFFRLARSQLEDGFRWWYEGLLNIIIFLDKAALLSDTNFDVTLHMLLYFSNLLVHYPDHILRFSLRIDTDARGKDLFCTNSDIGFTLDREYWTGLIEKGRSDTKISKKFSFTKHKPTCRNSPVHWGCSK